MDDHRLRHISRRQKEDSRRSVCGFDKSKFHALQFVGENSRSR
jgi:hypothetical protein